MIHFALPLFVVATVWFGASVYYQRAVRPLVIASVQFKLFSLRDKLRAKMIAGNIDGDSFAFGYLESLLNKLVHACSWFGIGSLIETMVVNPQRDRHPDIVRFDEEATAELKRLEEEAIFAIWPAMIANSPGWMVTLIALHPLAILIRWMRGRSERRSEMSHDGISTIDILVLPRNRKIVRPQQRAVWHTDLSKLSPIRC